MNIVKKEMIEISENERKAFESVVEIANNILRESSPHSLLNDFTAQLLEDLDVVSRYFIDRGF